MHTSQTYSTPQAARAAGIAVATLRTWQRQGVIQHCGEEPRPSYARRYPLAGVYELSLVAAMTRHGIERSLAIRVVRGEIAKWLAVDDPETDTLLREAFAQTKRILTEYRDIKRPAILVFGVDDSDRDSPVPISQDYARGWDDLPAAIERVRRSGKAHLLATVPWGSEAPRYTPGPPLSVVHVVDVTSVLAAVDARLAEEPQS
jgi:DNA-binding transcriptional MerR regulator